MPTIKFDQGNNETGDRGELKNGELQQSTGAFYKPGDPMSLHKIGGQAVFADTSTAKKVQGVAVLQYDAGGTDRVAALSDGTLYSAPLSGTGQTGTFSALKTGLSTSATTLSAAHHQDRHYMCNGEDKNWVVEADGTVYDMGMPYPTDQIVVVTSDGAGVIIRPAEPTGDLVNPSKTMDGDNSTFGYMTLSAPGTQTDTFTGWSGSTTARDMVFKFALSGVQLFDSDEFSSTNFDDTGGSVTTGYNVTLAFAVSTDAGVTFVNKLSDTTSTVFNAVSYQMKIASVDPADVRLKVTMTYNSGDVAATLRIYDVRMQTAAAGATFTATTGVYYGVAERDSKRGEQSTATVSPLVPFSVAANQATLTLPTAAKSSRSTDWIIYRTPDGGTAPSQLGQIAIIDISETTYIDDFADNAITEQPLPILPLLNVSVSTSTSGLNFAQDLAPSSFIRIRAFGAFLVGLSKDFPRQLSYNVPGLPGSWPDIYVITAFPMPEHDEILDIVEVGDSLVVGHKAVMSRLDDLPRIVQGQFNAGAARQIQGAPGLVGRYAMASFGVSGEGLAAWISHHGIFATNGQTYAKISDPGIDFEKLESFDKSNWVLHWDQRYHTLVFAYSVTGATTNDRYYLLHMHPGQRTNDGGPKITGPHYGAFNHLASAQVGNRRRMYSAHPSDGKVYLLDHGTTDASNAFDTGGTVPLIVKTGRVYGDDEELAVLDGKLHHTDFGIGQSVAVSWLTGRDQSGYEEAKSRTVSLSGQKATQFDISSSGDWHEVTLTHTGDAGGALRKIAVRSRSIGDAGEVSAA